ncbi:tyrosine--tRNA ligase [Wolbachia pipientis]|uniref:Tyrosine--tRNA ligase n=1 Tax=Wolbachia pipientis TaxID=955 RepID=A0A1E7QKF2_WOLPI|nr:tyrosine--tRNA ligase [Wolbachia pipientis]OEY86955.1 tyrosine--tRNA ligase [Wolbachia pipientis]
MNKSDFLNFLEERGSLYQCTNITGLDQLLIQDNHIVAYIGFDCTAPSLHIGSMIQIMVLRSLQKFGYKPIVLLGGTTTKVGDPTGKDKARIVLPTEEVNRNINGIREALERIIFFGDGISDAVIVNNEEWLDELGYIDFLCNIGTHVSVNNMLTFDSVRTRLEREQNLSFLEFNYMLLQAYDFTELSKRYGCRLQIGGSDQWGNIVNGIDLGRRLGLAELFGLTTPLILNHKGKKMGKTESGAIWINSRPYDYWQYFRNIDDQDVGRFLRLLTDLPIDEIKKLELLQDQEINEAKKILATEATKICHGKEEAEYARSAAVAAFENKDSSLLHDYTLKKEQLIRGIPLIDLLCLTGLESSKNTAKRLIQASGCRINDQIIQNIDYVISTKNFEDKSFIKLSSGKKRHIKVVII